MIPEREQRRLDHMVKSGYGWRKYAQNILDQGWISRKQIETVDDMYCRLINQQSLVERRKSQPKYRFNRSKKSDNELRSKDGWGYMFEASDYGGGYYGE